MLEARNVGNERTELGLEGRRDAQNAVGGVMCKIV
jgi:hypothetical protein